VAAVLVLAGCVSAPGDAAPPTGSSSSTPTATPTPTPTPTETVVAEDPANPGTWIVDGNGVGPIDIGMDVTLLPTYLPGLTHTECALSDWVRADGLSISPVTGFEHDQVFGVRLRAPSSAVLPDAPRTAAGIGIGSTQAEVESAYPGIALVDDGYLPPNYPVPLDGRFVIILLESGAVIGFTVSDSDQLPGDYC
jgi:hypothetical protein